jgi:hypothetical protein
MLLEQVFVKQRAIFGKYFPDVLSGHPATLARSQLR